MKKRVNPARMAIVFVVFALIIVGMFFYLSNRTDEEAITENESSTYSAVIDVLSRNLETNYPPTPKEVVKYYSEITRCFYGEKYTEEQLEKLATKSRELFDIELYENQTDEQYLEALKTEIADYKSQDKVISSFSVSSTTDVSEYYFDGYDWAQLYCIYSIRVGTKIAPVQEQYILRKDDVGHWKILGWKLVENSEASNLVK